MDRARALVEDFFSNDLESALAAARMLEGPDGPSRGAVMNPETFRRVAGRKELVFERAGLLCEVIFGPARDFGCSCGAVRGAANAGTACARCGVECGPTSLRHERIGHIEVQGVIHPAAFRMLRNALGLETPVWLEVARGEWALRDGQPVSQWLAEDGDLTGPAAILAALRRLDPAHPLLSACTLRRVPVPPPGLRPFVNDPSPMRVDPWIGWSAPPSQISSADTVSLSTSLETTEDVGTSYSANGTFDVWFDRVTEVEPGGVGAPVDDPSITTDSVHFDIRHGTPMTKLTKVMTLPAKALGTAKPGDRIVLMVAVFNGRAVGTRYTYQWK